jgi:hypothetical protein
MIQIHHSLTVRNDGQEVDTFDLTVDVSFSGHTVYYEAVRAQDAEKPYPEPLKGALVALLKNDDGWHGKVVIARTRWLRGQYINQMCDAKGGEA